MEYFHLKATCSLIGNNFSCYLFVMWTNMVHETRNNRKKNTLLTIPKMKLSEENNSLQLKMHQCRIKRNSNAVVGGEDEIWLSVFKSVLIQLNIFSFFCVCLDGLFDAFFSMCQCVIMMSRIASIFIRFFLNCETCSKRIGRNVRSIQIFVPFSGQCERCQLWESSSHEMFFNISCILLIFLLIALWFSWTRLCCSCSLKTDFSTLRERTQNVCQSARKRRYTLIWASLF